MTTVDAEGMGNRISEARSRAGLTQADLASAISLDRSALTKIENGTRRITALELAKIAEALDERIEWFVTEPPQAIVAHRNVQDAGAASPSIDRLAERVTRNVEFVVQHDVHTELANPNSLDLPESAAATDDSAAQARNILGIDDHSPLYNIATHAANIGLFTFCFDMGPDAADAASILLRRGGVAIVNGHLRVGRRRLAVAHELGHYLFADDYTVDWKVAEQTDNDVHESRIDRFARALLLPASHLPKAWEERRRLGDSPRTSAVKIASFFRVDMSTLARRLQELGCISNDEAQQVRNVRTTKADIVTHNLVPSDELDAPSLPHRYEQAVVRLYQNEVISAARAVDLLFDTWSEADFPKLPDLPANAIWQFVS